MTPLQEQERQAMLGDRSAVLRVISALRQYRKVVQDCLKERYADGAMDGFTAGALEDRVREIEEDDSEE